MSKSPVRISRMTSCAATDSRRVELRPERGREPIGRVARLCDQLAADDVRECRTAAGDRDRAVDRAGNEDERRREHEKLGPKRERLYAPARSNDRLPSADVLMNDPRFAKRLAASEAAPGESGRGGLLAALSALVVALGAAVAGEPPAANLDGAETLGVDSPIGRIEYYPGRGLRLGDTRITLGGFTKAEVNLLEGGDNRGGLEGPNFFLFFDPLPFVHAFSELETGTLVGAETGREGVRTGLAFGVERAYGDFGASDAATLRFGKFLTPVGAGTRFWPSRSLWTTSTPLIVEDVFDLVDHRSDAVGRGVPQGRGALLFVVRAFLDPLDPDPEAPPAKHTAGAHLDWASLDSWAVGASYFASQSPSRRRGTSSAESTVLWRPNARVELSGESVFGEARSRTAALWPLRAGRRGDCRYALRGRRYERFDPPDGGPRSISSTSGSPGSPSITSG